MLMYFGWNSEPSIFRRASSSTSGGLYGIGCSIGCGRWYRSSGRGRNSFDAALCSWLRLSGGPRATAALPCRTPASSRSRRGMQTINEVPTPTKRSETRRLRCLLWNSETYHRINTVQYELIIGKKKNVIFIDSNKYGEHNKVPRYIVVRLVFAILNKTRIHK